MIDKIKILEVGKFYLIHDGSKTGHPGLIIWKDDEHNLYLAIKFGTSKNEHNIRFKHPVGIGVKQSYFYKKSFLGKRRDFGSISFNDMIVTSTEMTSLKNGVDIMNPTFSSSINRKDKRFYKRTIK